VQADRGAAPDTIDLDPSDLALRREVAALGQPALDAALAGLVVGVHEDFADARPQALQFAADETVLAGRTVHADVDRDHPHRLAGIDLDHDPQAVAVGLAADFGARRVVAEGLERPCRLGGNAPQQELQPRRAEPGELRLVQPCEAQGGADIGGLGLGQAAHQHRPHRRRCRHRGGGEGSVRRCRKRGKGSGLRCRGPRTRETREARQDQEGEDP
jgi:hypothetical protein